MMTLQVIARNLYTLLGAAVTHDWWVRNVRTVAEGGHLETASLTARELSQLEKQSKHTTTAKAEPG